MKKIKTFSTKRMHVEEDFGFLKLAENEAKACFADGDDGGDDGSPSELSVLTSASPLLTTTLNAFYDAVDAFDVSLKESNSVPSAKVASEADNARDQSWRGNNAYVKAMTAHPDAAIASIAEEAKALFDKYGDPTDLPQTEESGVLHNLLQDLLALPEEKRASLALDAWIEDLKAKEAAFQAAVQARTAEEAEQTVGIIKQSRQTADLAYDKLVETVNALVVVEGEATYATFIDHMNALIDRQKTVLKTRSTLNEKKSEQTETEQ